VASVLASQGFAPRVGRYFTRSGIHSSFMFHRSVPQGLFLCSSLASQPLPSGSTLIGVWSFLTHSPLTHDKRVKALAESTLTHA